MSVLHTLPQMAEFMEEFGKVRCFNFFVYGSLTPEEVRVLGKGLGTPVTLVEPNAKMAVYSEIIDEDLAVALDCYRGSTLTVIFGGDTELEELVQTVILDGLDYYKYYAEYKGTQLSESNV